MSEEKCFCHLNGYKVKDADAREAITKAQGTIEEHTAKLRNHEGRIQSIEMYGGGNESIDLTEVNEKISALETTDNIHSVGLQDHEERIQSLEQNGTSIDGAGNIRGGSNNENTGAHNVQSGHYNANYVDDVLQVGNKNINGKKNNYEDGSPKNDQSTGQGSIQGGTKNENYAKYSFQSGQNNKNYGVFSNEMGVNNENHGSYSNLIGKGLRNAVALTDEDGNIYYISKSIFGQFNEDRTNTVFEFGNGTSDSERSNAFMVMKDGRAKVQSEPVEDDDVVRKKELDKVSTNTGGKKLYRHNIILEDPTVTGMGNVYISLISDSAEDMSGPPYELCEFIKNNGGYYPATGSFTKDGTLYYVTHVTAGTATISINSQAVTNGASQWAVMNCTDTPVEI